MTIDRVANSSQSLFFLNEITQASNALNKTQQQVASGKVSTDYAGIGGKTSALEAARASAGRADAYQSATKAALNQVNMQDTNLSQLSDLAQQLRTAMTTAAGNNDATGLMQQVQSIFDEASQILNSKDANGNYLFGGDKDNVPPFTATSLSDLASMTDVSDAFQNGSAKKTVMVGDNEPVTIGVLASDVGTQLMQTLKDIATFNASPSGNLQGQMTDAQATFVSNEVPATVSAATGLNNATAANGYVNNRLSDASDQQTALSTLYKGFVSNIEDVDMGTAVTQLNQNQTALQAALQVTAQLSQLSLLNFMPNS
jgi:flagellar hook-associated protein 3 FlgL